MRQSSDAVEAPIQASRKSTVVPVHGLLSGAGYPCSDTGGMSFQYDDSPNNLDSLISPDEAAAIAVADPRVFTKDTQRFTHFAVRVSRTIKAMRAQILEMHRDISSVQLARATTGAPATLSPLEAVRYLTPEQRASIADEATSELVESSTRLQREAQELKSLTLSKINEAKLLLGTIAEDPRLDHDTRVRVSAALARFSTSSAALTDLGTIFTESTPPQA